jgi:small subunit ribosomal protein S16
MAHKGGPRDRHPIDPMTGRPLDIEGLTIVDDPSTPQSENGAPIEEVAWMRHGSFML